MKPLIIVTHPNMSTSRVNKSWLEELQKHSELTVHELYKEYPDENINVPGSRSCSKPMTASFFNIRCIGIARHRCLKNGLTSYCFTVGLMAQRAVSCKAKKLA